MFLSTLLIAATVQAMEKNMSCVSCSPDDTQYALGTNIGQFYVLDKELNIIYSHIVDEKCMITSLCWSSDSRYVVISYDDADARGDTIVIVDMQTKKIPGIINIAKANTLAACLSPNAYYIAAAYYPGKIFVLFLDENGSWNITTSYEFETNGTLIYEVCCSPDSTLVAACSGKAIEIWNLKDANPEMSGIALIGHTADVLSIDFSPDGKNIISGSEDTTIKIWDSITGECLHTLTGHTSYVSSVRYGKDGKFIVSGSRDTTIKLWNIENEPYLFKTIRVDAQVLQISLNSDKILAGFPDLAFQLYDISELNKHTKDNPAGEEKTLIMRSIISLAALISPTIAATKLITHPNIQ